MRRRSRRVSVVLALVGLTLVLVAPPADAVGKPTAAWWSRLATADPASQAPAALPVPAPTTPETIPAGATVPDGQLLVEGTPDGATAITAIRWELEPGVSGPSLTLPIAAGSSVNPQSVVLACRAATPWTTPEARAGSWDDKPLVDGGACINGIIAADLSTISFGLQPLVSGTTLDVVLAPGRTERAEVPAGVPEPPADIDGSTFRLLLDPPAPEALTVVAGSGFEEGSGDQVVTPEAAPPPDLGAGIGPLDSFEARAPTTPVPVVTTPVEVAAPTLEPQDLAPSVPELDAVPAAVASPVDRTVGFVILALAALLAAWSYWVSNAADDSDGSTTIGLGRFRTTVPAPVVAAVAGASASGSATVGGLSRFARPRDRPPTPLG